MKRFLPLSVSLFALAIAGCGEESDDLPVDGRDFDGEAYSEPAPYSGKVIDGYLRNARVWLDLDGDSQYTAGPVTVELDSGSEVTLASGEPTALSGEDGAFVLDISELVSDPADAPNLDPRDYPLFAVALPGKTVEQLRHGDETITDAYMMSAPPGVTNITPLTTLVRHRRLAGAGSASDSLARVNLLSDYIRSGDERAHAYARAMARFMASQFPYSDVLAKRNADGTERVLSSRAAYLLGLSLAQNAPGIVELVDEAAASGDYGNVNVAELDLPDVPLELADPLLVTGQRVSAYPENGSLPGNRSSLEVSAESQFDYSPDGRLLSVSVNGCMNPSMPELVRLINAGGRMADLGTQWLPSVSLSLASRAAYEADGVDERLTFDWAQRKAYFETAASCHEGLADGSELGGPAEITYTWTLDGDKVAELSAVSDVETRTLAPDYTNSAVPEDAGGPYSAPLFNGYRQSVEGNEEVVSLTGEVTDCTVEAGDEEPTHAVSATQPYSFTAAAAPEGFGELTLELDTRNDAFRLLRYTFADPVNAGFDHVDSDNGFDWIMYYPPTGSAGYTAEQPNLITSAYLTEVRLSASCGREFEDAPTAVFGRVEYQYKRLSEYLTGLVE
ncbi:MAG: hypothetical protein ACQEV6_17025 [Pseudomonadota bacterium]